jgi:hypothetical protein
MPLTSLQQNFAGGVLRPASTPPSRLRTMKTPRLLVLTGIALLPHSAHASLFHGETLDSIANGLAWIILFLVPIVGIAVFWLVHILPEKLAYKKKHPQAKAIHCLCLLSLVFGGMLWPLAWLWAYSKPVLHKLAYGTDVDESPGHGHGDTAEPIDENTQLRLRVAELESQLGQRGAL